MWKTYQIVEFITWFGSTTVGDLPVEILVTTIKQGYLSYFVHYYMGGWDRSLGEVTRTLVFELLYIYALMLIITLFYNWIGFLYVGANSMNEGSENLLNNVKEGVCVMSKEDFTL